MNFGMKSYQKTKIDATPAEWKVDKEDHIDQPTVKDQEEEVNSKTSKQKSIRGSKQNYQQGQMENNLEWHNKEEIKEKDQTDQSQDQEMNHEDKKCTQKDTIRGNTEKNLKKDESMHYLCYSQQERNLQTQEELQKNSKRDCKW